MLCPIFVIDGFCADDIADHGLPSALAQLYGRRVTTWRSMDVTKGRVAGSDLTNETHRAAPSRCGLRRIRDGAGAWVSGSFLARSVSAFSGAAAVAATGVGSSDSRGGIQRAGLSERTIKEHLKTARFTVA